METLPNTSDLGIAPRILVVEDEESLANQLQITLEAEGYVAFWAKDGVDALTILQSQSVDLILADVMMPRMDGFELCESIRRDSSLGAIPLVFLTARNSREDRLKGRELGADDFITKPFEIEELLAIVKTRIERTRQIRTTTEDGYAAKITRNLSHELRTPITVIQGLVSLLESERNLEPGTQKEFLKALRQNSKLLNKLVENFLHLARTESNSFEMVKRPTDIGDVVNDVRNSFSEMATEKGIAITVECDKDLPTIHAHTGSITVLFSNVIDNAIKFTPAGGSVLISASRKDGTVEVRVKDTGIGVRKENVSRVFEKFYREETASHQNPGAGLGLTIAHRVSEAHGGSIRFDRDPGGGSIVSVELSLS